MGLMPHPERACELALGSADGLVLFESVVTGGRERGDAAGGGAMSSAIRRRRSNGTA